MKKEHKSVLYRYLGMLVGIFVVRMFNKWLLMGVVEWFIIQIVWIFRPDYSIEFALLPMLPLLYVIDALLMAAGAFIGERLASRLLNRA